ncbi:hypothetical protein ABZ915_47735 [Streptomyces sp. NPDC046915]|uniref:hypothetical protein n=1 Tax=Streptomyces sp. NPDC046915 TaxID=3155257 RepID=UPI0033FFD4C1
MPYIAPWSAERVELSRLTVVSGALAVKGQRRAAGVLWKPWRDKPGVGKPAFAKVHGPRQRECMLRKLCQVCRCRVAPNEFGWPWLLDHRGEGAWPEAEVTTHPPTCEECQPVAQLQCTPNRGNFVSVRVGRLVTDGVHGQMYQRAAHPIPVGKERVLYAGDARLRWMLGAQIAATLLDVTVVGVPSLGTQAPALREAVRR